MDFPCLSHPQPPAVASVDMGTGSRLTKQILFGVTSSPLLEKTPSETGSSAGHGSPQLTTDHFCKGGRCLHGVREFLIRVAATLWLTCLWLLRVRRLHSYSSGNNTHTFYERNEPTTVCAESGCKRIQAPGLGSDPALLRSQDLQWLSPRFSFRARAAGIQSCGRQSGIPEGLEDLGPSQQLHGGYLSHFLLASSPQATSRAHVSPPPSPRRCPRGSTIGRHCPGSRLSLLWYRVPVLWKAVLHIRFDALVLG